MNINISCVRMLCVISLLGIFSFSCATVKEPDPTPDLVLEKTLDAAAQDLADQTIALINRRIEMGELIGAVIIEDKEWRSETWNKLGEEFFEYFKHHFMNQMSWLTFIRPFANWEDMTTIDQFGRCVFKCGESSLPDYRIRLEIELEKYTFSARVNFQKVSSTEELPGILGKPISMDESIAGLARKWLKEQRDPPFPDGGEDRPFKSDDLAAIFLSKVICCSIPEVKQKYYKDLEYDLSNEIRIKLARLVPEGDFTPSGAFLEKITTAVQNELSRCCQNLSQVASGREVDEIVKTLKIIHNPGVYKTDQQLQGPKLETPTVLIQGTVSRKEALPNTFSVNISGSWLLTRYQGLRISEFSAGTCFKSRNSDDLCETLRKRLSGFKKPVVRLSGDYLLIYSSTKPHYYLYELSSKELTLKWSRAVQPFATETIPHGKWIFIASSGALPGQSLTKSMDELVRLLNDYRGAIEIFINCE